MKTYHIGNHELAFDEKLVKEYELTTWGYDFGGEKFIQSAEVLLNGTYHEPDCDRIFAEHTEAEIKKLITEGIRLETAVYRGEA